MSKKLPALQLYPGDWRKDPAVQALDFEHRGIWFEILLLMHESEQRGKLLLNGKPMPDEALARLLGLDVQKVKKVKSVLIDYGVASICDDTGAMMNRRMVRDEEKRQKKVIAGRKGGKISKRKAKEGSSSSSSSSSSDKQYTREFERFWESYDVKKGKKKAWQEWKKLSTGEKAEIMENVPVFLTHFSSKHYTPRPRKYLYNRYWEDEDYQKPKTSNYNGTEQPKKGENRTERFIRRGSEVLEGYPDGDA